MSRQSCKVKSRGGEWAEEEEAAFQPVVEGDVADAAVVAAGDAAGAAEMLVAVKAVGWVVAGLVADSACPKMSSWEWRYRWPFRKPPTNSTAKKPSFPLNAPRAKANRLKPPAAWP